MLEAHDQLVWVLLAYVRSVPFFSVAYRIIVAADRFQATGPACDCKLGESGAVPTASIQAGLQTGVRHNRDWKADAWVLKFSVRCQRWAVYPRLWAPLPQGC